MDPNVWGPPAWLFLHSVTLNYPKNPTPQDQEDYRIFFDSLNVTLANVTGKSTPGQLPFISAQLKVKNLSVS